MRISDWSSDVCSSDLRIDGRYGGAMMLCVLPHFARAQLGGVLGKLADALEAGGPLLLMYTEGDGEQWEPAVAGDSLMLPRAHAAVAAHMLWAGSSVAGAPTAEGRGGSWGRVHAGRKTRATP